MTNSMIEIAARAAYENARSQDFTMQYDPKTHRVYMDGYFELKEIVRAVLSAIREPNEAMMKATGMSYSVVAEWKAAIDSILKEGTP